MENKLISVIVPIYNIEQFVRRCVDSIIAQTYKNLEIILVDDGSTDSCPQICDEYKKIDERIVVIHKKNGGLSDARNAGMKIAKGELWGFIDGDDCVSPFMYEAMYKSMREHNADLVTCKPTYDKKSLRQANDKPLKILDATTGEDAIKYLCNDHVCGNYAWNKLCKKNLYDGLEYPKGKHFEDIYIMHDVFFNAKKVVLLDENLYFYMVREGQITNGETVKFSTIKDHIGAFEIRFNDPRLKKHQAAIYAISMHMFKRCKRLAIQNKVTDEDKKAVIKYVNSKIRKYCTKEHLSKKDYIQAQVLLHCNHVAVLAHITNLRKKILGH